MTAPVIKLVTDSTADLPTSWVQKWGIHVVPMVVNIGSESLLDDGVQLRRGEFYEQLATMSTLPTTAGCSLGQAQDILARAGEQADYVIIISLAAVLSATHETLRLAAEETLPGRYTLVDSGQLSMGIGWIVAAAAEAIERSESLDDVLAAITRTRQQVRTFAVLSTLDNLRKSGRVGWSMAMAANLLQIKPIIDLRNGEAILVERVRTFKRALDRLIEIGHEQAPIERLAVLHIHNPAGAEAVAASLGDVYPFEQVLIAEANPAMGLHLGIGAVGFALVKTDVQAS